MGEIMGIQILLRRTVGDNPFRRALGKLMELEGEELVLASGYASYGLFSNHNLGDFVNKIKTGFTKATNPRIIIIGGMFKKNIEDPSNPGTYITKIDTTEFQRFVDGLKNQFINSNVSIEVHRAKTNSWHSKIAIKRKSRTEPIACIVGSSNLTVPAFSVNWQGFNHESDVFFLKKGFRGIRNIKHTVQELIFDRDELIEEFIDVLRARNRAFKKEEIKILCSSSERFETIHTRAIEVFNGENEEDSYVLDIVFMINEYNKLIEAAGDNQEVTGTSVISVRAYKLQESQILNDINSMLNSALGLYTDKKSSGIF